MKAKIYEDLHKLNWMFFLMIVFLVVLLFFASIIKYVFVTHVAEQAVDAGNTLDVNIKENTVMDLYGAARPIVVVEATAANPSYISFELTSDKHSDSFKTAGYTTYFEKLFFIPPEAHSTEFLLHVTARDKEGKTIEKELEFRTKKVLISGNRS